jgi:hypothetical protein
VLDHIRLYPVKFINEAVLIKATVGIRGV